MDKDFNNIMDDMRKEIEAYKKFEKEIKQKVEDLKDVLNRCTEEKHNFELLCNSFKERNNQLTKELEENEDVNLLEPFCEAAIQVSSIYLISSFIC